MKSRKAKSELPSLTYPQASQIVIYEATNDSSSERHALLSFLPSLCALVSANKPCCICKKLVTVLYKHLSNMLHLRESWLSDSPSLRE